MILSAGMKVLVVHRRLFETDHERFFVGVVDGYAEGLARVTGRTWLCDSYSGEPVCKEDERTKIVSLSSGALIVYQLPSAVELGALRLSREGERTLLSDGARLRMDMSERVSPRASACAPERRSA
jgi:hypothetical protein